MDSPPKKRYQVDFDDPPRLALEAESEEEALPHYRHVRDEIRRFIETLPEGFKNLVEKGL